MRTLILLLALAPAFAGEAPAAKKTLAELSAEFRESPDDEALRDAVFAAARALKRPPAVPEEAERRMTRAQAYAELAQDDAGFAKVVAELKEAVRAAPWWPQAYFNLGLAQEKSKDFTGAMATFKLYLKAAPDAANADAVKKRVYKLEVLAEEAAPAPPAPAMAVAPPRKGPSTLPPDPLPPLDPASDFVVMASRYSGKTDRFEIRDGGFELFHGTRAHVVDTVIPDSHVRTRTYHFETPEGLFDLGMLMVSRSTAGATQSMSTTETLYDPPILTVAAGLKDGMRWSSKSTYRIKSETTTTGPYGNVFEHQFTMETESRYEVTGEDTIRIGDEKVRCLEVTLRNRSTTNGKTTDSKSRHCFAPGIGWVRSSGDSYSQTAVELHLTKPAYGTGALPAK